MINKDTKVYCSFAKTAGNLGCELFNFAFKHYGIDAIYKSFSVNSIKKAVDATRTLDIKGFAVSMPYKYKVLDYVDEWSDDVMTIGAANTVINQDGHLKAYNTDYLAAKEFLVDYLDEDTYVIVIGSGGYASAVTSAIIDLGTFKTRGWINRKNWHLLKDLKNCLLFNCTPLENIEFDKSNTFIDCLVTSKTGKELSWLQASHQFKMYTGRELEIGVI